MLDLPNVADSLVVLDVEASGLHRDDGARVSMLGLGWLRPDWQVRRRSGEDEYDVRVYAVDQGPLPDKRDAWVREIVDDERYGLPEWPGDGLGGKREVRAMRAWERLSGAAWGDSNVGRLEWGLLLEWLSWQRLAGHNLKYDLHMLDAGHRVWGRGRDLSRCWVWDTMLAQAVLEPEVRAGYGLDVVGRRLGLGSKVGEEAVEQWWQAARLGKARQRHARLDLPPPAVVEPYCAGDVLLTLKLMRYQLGLLETGWDWAQRVVERELALGRVLFGMERRGLGFDRERCTASCAAIEGELRRMQLELPFRDLNGAKRYWFETLALEPVALTAVRGEPKLDEEAVEVMVERGAPWATEFQRLRTLESARAKWYAAWPQVVGGDGRLRGSFRQLKVVSGRLSVERVTLQGIPHDEQLGDVVKLGSNGHDAGAAGSVVPVRELLCARPGCELWEFDLGQAEIRVATAIADCKGMLTVLRSAEHDVHGGVARQVFGVTPENEQWKRLRQVAKQLSFATLYGGEIPAVIRTLRKGGLHASTSDAARWLQEYRDTFPEFVKCAARAERIAMSRGWLRLAGGRMRWFKERDAHTAFNALIQGGVAELAKVWMINVDRIFPEMLLLQIHDSLLLEIPSWQVAEVRDRVVRIGKAIYEKAFAPVPFVVESKPWAKV
jgi:DNA polymerase I-like protein with 3'-5' exonuclease and polymerase domains